MPAARGWAEAIGTLVAMPAEARSLGARGLRAGDCVRWRRGWIAVSGVGARNAALATRRLVDSGVAGIANWGIAGGLDARLAPGDVVVAEAVADDATGAIATDATWSASVAAALAARLRVHRGTLWSARRAVTAVDDKRALAAASGALAVDMEAAYAAAIARAARLPFIAVKAICDPAVRALPAELACALGPAGRPRALRLARALASGGPDVWRAALALGRDFARARRSLATAATLTA